MGNFNFVNKKNTTKKLLTRFNNINDHTQKYTAEEIEKLLKENQKRKFDKKKEEELKLETENNNNKEIEITNELICKCIENEEYFKSLHDDAKLSIRKYIIDEGMFIPLHIQYI